MSNGRPFLLGWREVRLGQRCFAHDPLTRRRRYSLGPFTGVPNPEDFSMLTTIPPIAAEPLLA